MIIKWDPDAKVAMQQVARYINMRFGRKARQGFMQRVKDTEKLIKSSPNIGQIDPLYADRPETYRSIIIYGLNKLVYRIEGEIIFIAAFWDTRQEPEAKADQTR